jgi:hypothetical protein
LSTLPTASNEEWVTQKQAAWWLGVDSFFLFRSLIRNEGLHCKEQNGHEVVPLPEVEPLQDHNTIWKIRETNRDLEAIGGGNGLTQEEMANLELGRIRKRSPWEEAKGDTK